MSERWHVDSRTCSHSGHDVCSICDLDAYKRQLPQLPMAEGGR